MTVKMYMYITLSFNFFLFFYFIFGFLFLCGTAKAYRLTITTYDVTTLPCYIRPHCSPNFLSFFAFLRCTFSLCQGLILVRDMAGLRGAMSWPVIEQT